MSLLFNYLFNQDYLNSDILVHKVACAKNGLSPEIMREIFVFQENETYNLNSGNHLTRKNIQTTQYRIESVSNLGAKLWNLLSGEIKNNFSVTIFKNKIRK